MAEIEWVQSRYGDNETVDAGLLQITVCSDMFLGRDHTGPRFKWIVNEWKSAKRFETKEEAKASALRFAKKKLQAALDILGS